MREPWALLKEGVRTFLDDEVLSRGAAIAFYATTALVPILYISALIAGLVFGRAAASTAIASVIGHLVGSGTAEFLTTAIYNAHDPGTLGKWRNIVTLVLLIITSTGVFAEIQAALNRIWDAEPRIAIWWQMLRARLASLALVLAFGSSSGFASHDGRDQRTWRTYRRRSARRHCRGMDIELRDLVRPDRASARGDLSRAAGLRCRMARRGHRRHRHHGPAQHRRIFDRSLSGIGPCRRPLRHGGQRDRAADLDLLHRADIPARRRLHPRLVRTSRQPRSEKRTRDRAHPIQCELISALSLGPFASQAPPRSRAGSRPRNAAIRPGRQTDWARLSFATRASVVGDRTVRELPETHPLSLSSTWRSSPHNRMRFADRPCYLPADYPQPSCCNRRWRCAPRRPR